MLKDSLDADVGLNTIGASGLGTALSYLLQTDVFDSSLSAAANLTNLLELAGANQLYVLVCFSLSFFLFPSVYPSPLLLDNSSCGNSCLKN